MANFPVLLQRLALVVSGLSADVIFPGIGRYFAKFSSKATGKARTSHSPS